MSLELLKNIEKAESAAEAIRAEAQREARELLKAVEEVTVSNEREAVQENRRLTQRVLEDARETAGRSIDKAAQAEAKKREEIAARARGKIGTAADLIFERVVSHGDR